MSEHALVELGDVVDVTRGPMIGPGTDFSHFSLGT
jgi:hypothetical protein